MIQQTPWIERNFNFSFSIYMFPVIFSRLEGTLFRLHHVLVAADDEGCSYHPYGWSVKQHLGHLADLEALWWQRLQDYEEGKEVMTPADINNSKTESANHNENSLENIMQTLVMERQKMLETIYDFDPSFLSSTCLHPRLNIPFRMVDLLYFIAEHDDHHIAAISTILRKPAR